MQGFIGSKTGWIITLAIAALGVYLFFTHTGHMLSALPYLLLLACPLMHLFGHGHGGHSRHEHKNKQETPRYPT